MNAQASKRLLGWLEDAYAMEQEAETMMKAMAGRIENYPELKQRIEHHVQETKWQAEQIAECINQLGGSVPDMKGAFAKAMAGMHAMGNAMMSDEVAKGVGISYAFEHMEVATYRALVLAARREGQEAVAEACEGILRQEEAMAQWLYDQQPAIIESFLEREAADVEAKR